MSNLEKLSQLFTDLQTEVIGLEKRRDAASADLATKEAKLSFLSTAIAESETKHTHVKANQLSAVSQLEQQIANLKRDLTSLEQSITALKTDQQVAQSELETIRGAITTAQERLEKLEATRQQELATVDDTLVAKQSELADLTKQIAARQTVLQELETVVDAKKTEVQAETTKLESDMASIKQLHRETVAKLDDKQDELELLTQQVVDKQATLDQFTKQQADFADYQKRAIAALEAREAAILDKEETLALSRRRPGILDNI